jgi:putative SOS response-associated peptidase YedK
MCGRYTLTATPEEVRRLFRYVDNPNFPGRWNIAPTQPIAIVAPSQGERRFMLVRWGLLPSWCKDPKTLPLMINARVESVADKPAFRGALRHRRALIPASGFYEWQKLPNGRKQPYHIRPVSGLVGFAGLWETWLGADGSEIDTAAIITTAANRTLAPVHDRMPAVVSPEDYDAWLDTANVGAREALALLKPVPEDFFEAVPVSERVNRVVNDDKSLVAPLSEPLAAAPAAGKDAPPRDAPPPAAEAAPAARAKRTAAGAKRDRQLDLF